MARKVDISLCVVFVVLIYHSHLSNGSVEDQTKHQGKRAIGSMFTDILKSIKTNFVPSSKSNQKGGDGGDAKSGGSWRNMVPDIAKAFMPDEDQDYNNTSTEDMQDNDSSSNITEVDPQATEVNAGVTENMGEDAKLDKQSPQDSGKQDDVSQVDKEDSGTKAAGSEGKANETAEKQGIATEKQNEKVNEGITENMEDNGEFKLMLNGTTSETVTTTPDADNQKQLQTDNDVQDNDTFGPLSWEEESKEIQGDETHTEDGAEMQKKISDQTEAEEDTVKVNAGVTENLGNDNVNPKPVDSASSEGHDASNNETATKGETLKFAKGEPLSWENESPEILEAQT